VAGSPDGRQAARRLPAGWLILMLMPMPMPMPMLMLMPMLMPVDPGSRR